MFDERHFPYEYECDGCGASPTVEHEDVQDVPSYFRTRTVAEAVEYVMTEQRHWALGGFGESRCPECAAAQ
ncbi:hypothetical protein [Salinibacter ruber]|uniref:hypothetical protein n=1 Tax=Salinibacter ruber TaxID=146919 RepID=UPI0021674607|nr:hypothetical protein [Salinibacter ruber]MCS4119347.1 hypothetical protein [Salinibacter ruber]MCS4142629.1 hypothetical protein [Salinibacter ruber]